jgi:hypothetical protein
MSTDFKVAKQCFEEIISLKGETAREEVLEIVKS